MTTTATFIRCPTNPRAHKTGPLRGLVLASEHGTCPKHGTVSRAVAGRLDDLLRVEQVGRHFQLEHPDGQLDAIVRPSPVSLRARVEDPSWQ